MTNDVTNENDFSSLEEKLWDEITKKIALKMPSQFLPLLNEQFHKDYPEGTSITTLSTESITLPKQSNRKMGKIMSDIVFLVQNKDIYHVECEINLDDEMVIRMIEYDFHTALTHQLTTGQNQTPTLHFPQSIIVYPGNKKSIPDQQTCVIRFADGYEHPYQVPIIKVQDFSLDEIDENQLTLFLPFTLLRFQPRIQSATNPLGKKELTDFIRHLIVILEKQVNQGRLTVPQYKDYVTLIRYSAEHIFQKAPQQQQEEVNSMLESVLVLPSDEIDAIIAEKDEIIAEKDAEIQRLLEELNQFKKQSAQQ